MITLIHGDKVFLKPINQKGFICQSHLPVYFDKMIKDLFACSLSSNFTKHRIILVYDYQIQAVYDGLTNVIKYQHNPSDAL